MTPEEQDTRDRDLARWQGKTDAHMEENSRRLDGINGSILGIERDVNAMRGMMADQVSDLKVEIATIKTRVAIWSSLGGLIGAGIISGILTLALRFAG